MPSISSAVLYCCGVKARALWSPGIGNVTGGRVTGRRVRTMYSGVVTGARVGGLHLRVVRRTLKHHIHRESETCRQTSVHILVKYWHFKKLFHCHTLATMWLLNIPSHQLRRYNHVIAIFHRVCQWKSLIGQLKYQWWCGWNRWWWIDDDDLAIITVKWTRNNHTKHTEELQSINPHKHTEELLNCST